MNKRKRVNRETDLPQGEVNIIPIVDVSFTLVIFCMATMNLMLTSGINVLESRSGAASGKVTLKENISITLTKDYHIMVDNKEVARDDLFRELAILMPKTKDNMVIINADADNTCAQIVDVLDISKQSGAKRMALMQSAEPAPAPTL
jgi:biopolymer transport protein ExbD